MLVEIRYLKYLTHLIILHPYVYLFLLQSVCSQDFCDIEKGLITEL